MSFSARIKGKFKDAVKFINHFEQTAADLAMDKNYDFVICGHIHQPEIREVQSSVSTKTVTYLNSGDWVESLTALEYQQGKWRIFDYQETVFEAETSKNIQNEQESEGLLNVKDLLERFRTELQ
ncbi:MAG: UDP-2,3-diacylglucosamine diphosphatase [Janthinobacterium lividum]